MLITSFVVVGKSCSTPSDNPGICKKFSTCPALFNLFLNKPISPQNRELIIRSQCATQKDIHYVCCPQSKAYEKKAETPATVFSSPWNHDPTNEPCTDPFLLPGKCVQFKTCKKLYDIFNTTEPLLAKDRHILRVSQCGFYKKTPYVCCSPEFSKNSEVPSTQTPMPTYNESIQIPTWLGFLRKSLPRPPYCGKDSRDKIFGGKETELDEFPWTVLLEFDKCMFRYKFSKSLDG